MAYEFIDTESWIPVHSLPGFECCIEYYINKRGDVKSTKGQVEKILKPRLKNGYKQINLTQRIGRGPHLTVYVHTLVALAFLQSPKPLGRGRNCSRVYFINGDSSDCRVENLTFEKINKLKNNAEASNGRAHAAELGEDQSLDGSQR